MDAFQMLANDGNLVTLDEPEIKIFRTSREKDAEVDNCDPLCIELTPSERANLHQPRVKPTNVTNSSRSTSLLLVKTYPRFGGGKVGEEVVSQNVVVPPSAVPKSTLLVPVTEPAQTSTHNRLRGQICTQKQPTNLHRVTSVLLPPPPPKTPARSDSGRKPVYFLNSTVGPPHDETQGSACQCISCMGIYLEKLYKISPKQYARERASYARKLYRRNETPEKREILLAKGREAQRKRMETLPPEKREILLAKNRECQRKRHEKLSEEKREILLAKGREAQRKRMETLPPEKRQILLAKGREAQRKRHEKLSEEKREIMLAKGWEAKRKRHEKLSEETSKILLAKEGEVEGKSSPRRNPDPHEMDKDEEVKEEVESEKEEEDEYEDNDEPERQSSSDPQRRRRAKRTIETLKLEVQRRNALSKLRRLAETPEQHERRMDRHRKARAKRALEKERLGFVVPRQHLTIDQKIEQIAALEEAMKREEEEEKKFINSYKYDHDDGQDPDGHDSCTVCSVLVRKEDMGFHMKYHAEQEKKKTSQIQISVPTKACRQGQGQSETV